VRTLWERTAPHGQCGRSAVRGIAISVALCLGLIAAVALGLF